MNRRQANSTTNSHVYISIFALLTGALLFGLVGAEAMTTSDITRSSEVHLVQVDSQDAIIGISPQALNSGEHDEPRVCYDRKSSIYRWGLHDYPCPRRS